jgi:endoglucanase
LFRLIGGNEFKSIFEAGWAKKVDLSEQTSTGAWEYYNATHPGTDQGLKDRIKMMFLSQARMVAQAQGAVSYPSMKHPYAPIGWGQGLAPDFTQTQMFIRAHQLSRDPMLLRTMEVASAQILGANQVGLSFTTGLGARNVRHPLHEDHRAMGVKVPDGITLFGWGAQSAWAFDWLFGPFWTPLPVSGTEDNARHRMIVPNRFAMPFYEYLIEHPLVVIQQEYTVYQTIGTTAAMWLYLHAAGLDDQQAPLPQ